MTLQHKERLNKRNFLCSFCVSKAVKLLALGTAVFSVYGFQETDNTSHQNKSTQTKKLNIGDSVVIEVITSQQLFVINVLSAGDKNKVNVNAELKDAFKAVRYEKNSKACETGWLLLQTPSRFSAGRYIEGDAAFKELDSLISKTNKVRAAKK